MDEVNGKFNILIGAYFNLGKLMEREEASPLRPAYYTAAIIENINDPSDQLVFF